MILFHGIPGGGKQPDCQARQLMFMVDLTYNPPAVIELI